MKEALKKAIDKASELLSKKEDENEHHLHEVDRKWIIEAMMDYAEYFLSGMSEKPTNHIKISDEEIDNRAVLAMEERYGSGCSEEIDAYYSGAKWMREQLKQK